MPPTIRLLPTPELPLTSILPATKTLPAICTALDAVDATIKLAPIYAPPVTINGAARYPVAVVGSRRVKSLANIPLAKVAPP